MDDKINFVGKHEKWIVAKKMEITEKTNDVDIARLLLSVRDTVDRKLFEYFEKDFDMEEIDSIVADIVPEGRMSGEKVAEVFKQLKYSVPRKLEGNKVEKEVKKQLITEKVLEKLSFNTLDADTLDKYIKRKEMNKTFD